MRMRYVIHRRPAEAVVPRLKAEDPSTLVCPNCHQQIITPTRWNIQTGTEERMVLIPHRHSHCPGCGVMHWIVPDISRPHNRHLFPNDPQVWDQSADWQEEN